MESKYVWCNTCGSAFDLNFCKKTTTVCEDEQHTRITLYMCPYCGEWHTKDNLSDDEK